MFADLPGAPGSVRVVDVTPVAVSLGWDEPMFDGGTPILGYHVECKQAG